MSGSFRAAAVQESSVWLDRAGSTAKACALIEQAGARGRHVLALPASFGPRFPSWGFVKPLRATRPWPAPPLPGEQNPDTGQAVPDPLAPGSLYYDSNTGTLNVWNGTAWTSPTALAQGYVGQFVYTATAGQTIFSGADDEGNTPVVGTSPSDVFLNGVRLISGEDYVVNGPTSTLTINTPVTAGSMVQWDLLVPAGQLAPGSVNAFKIKPVTLDGSTQDFPLQYIDPGSGDTIDAAVGNGAQLMVSLDGCVQEPGKDYTATGATIHFLEAPDADSALWMVWQQPGAPA